MDRDYVLKNFWRKLSEAKRQCVKEVKLSLKEMDDLGYCIYELLTEYYDKTIDNVKNGLENNDENYDMDGGSF